jgi:CRISPR-associated endonuclease/helicase Cas3
MDVEPASLATEEPKYGLSRFDSARAFQNRTVEWIHDGTEPVAVVRAPTGGGKTATFLELIDEQSLTLLVYPTNALMAQQQERLADAGFRAEVVNSETLQRRGVDRTRELLQYANPQQGHDAVITNPDVLQAVVQDMYAGEQAVEMFDRFDGIIYDEFHFYGDLAASGLLTQIKLFTGRVKDVKILLASATPNESFVDFLGERLDLDVRDIGAEYEIDGDRFRHGVTVHRHGDSRLFEKRESVCERLRDALDSYDEESTDTRAVVVFNSVKDSNDFHEYLYNEYPDLFEVTTKDNGFDTNDADATVDDSFRILNTTSKGEVGLDYDVRCLLMDSPRDASRFLQRFGRAGRVGPADVHIYGLKQMRWPERLSYPEFVEVIYESLESSQMDLGQLGELVGFRAAYALTERTRRAGRRPGNPEVFEDFGDIEHSGKWRRFINSVREARSKEESFIDGPGKQEKRLIEFIESCFEGFRGLRGRSLGGKIRYPRGDRSALTNYDLLTTLRHYDITGIDEHDDGDVLILGSADDRNPSLVNVRYPGYEKRPKKYDGPNWKVEQDLREWIHREIDRAKLDEQTDVSEGLVRQFFGAVNLTEIALPTRVRCGEYEIEVEDPNGPTSVTYRRRDP